MNLWVLLVRQFFFTGLMPFLSFPFSVLGDGKGIQPVNKAGCWFVGGAVLTGALHIL